MQSVKGYKVFDPNFKCRGFQFEEGKDYAHKGKIKICSSGFHFCLQANDCFNYYEFNTDNIVCEVEAIGVVETHDGDSKACTDHIKIIRRLSWEEVLSLVNTGKANTGRGNSGDRNSGDRNSGNWNSGDWNSGNWNSGNWNSGNWNSGDSNSGYRNSGNWNSGDWNSGDSNSGYRNSGNWNSGNWNSGYRNSGNWNSGNWNSGDSNSGYRNSGAFCADNNPKIYLFDSPTDMTVREWENSKAYQIMADHLNPNIWVPESLMSDKEKEENPSYKTSEGYLKTISLKESWANMWPQLSDENKKAFTSLPNFCSEKFKSITGIDVNA